LQTANVYRRAIPQWEGYVWIIKGNEAEPALSPKAA
jgi:hypothetical protein